LLRIESLDVLAATRGPEQGIESGQQRLSSGVSRALAAGL